MKLVPVKKTSAATAAQQAPVGALVVKEGEDAWTAEELDEVVTELHQQRQRGQAADHGSAGARAQQRSLGFEFAVIPASTRSGRSGVRRRTRP